jgi:glycine dehydrogenase
MLATLGYDSLDALVDATVPEPGLPLLHRDGLPRLHHPAGDPAQHPGEPGLVHAYTPYQAEIAQGRLEALLNFQTMVIDLTGLPIANASLLDEATAAAEAMAMATAIAGARSGTPSSSRSACHPQTIDVVRTRAEARGIEVLVGDHRDVRLRTGVFGVLLQYPATDGRVEDLRAFAARAREAGRAGHRRGGPARADAAHPAGRVGRGHRGRHHAALRRAHGLRRPARRVLRHARRVQAADPGRIIGVSRDAAATRRCAWRCRRASSTSAARRRPATSARRRCCWR